MDMKSITDGITGFFNDATQMFGEGFESLKDSFSRITSGDIRSEDVVTLAVGGLSGVFLGSTCGAGTLVSLAAGALGMMASSYVKDNFFDKPEAATVPAMPASPTNTRNMQP